MKQIKIMCLLVMSICLSNVIFAQTSKEEELSAQWSTFKTGFMVDIEENSKKEDPYWNNSAITYTMKLAVDMLDAISALAKDVQKTKGDISMQIDDGNMKISEILSKVNYWRPKAIKLRDGEEKQKTENIAPYTKVLKNDKLSLVKENPPNEYRYYTLGKKVIETPAQLAAASVWAFEGVKNQGSITEKWTVHLYYFDANHTIIKENTKSGYGTVAPSSVFK